MNPLFDETRNRYVLHPVVYQDVYDLAERAEAALWTTGEVPLKDDKRQFDALPAETQLWIKHVLAFFAASDGIVNENLAQRFMVEIKMPEARYFYGIQIGIETIHSKMYSILLELYVSDVQERLALFDAIHTIPTIQAKAVWAETYIGSTASFATRLLAFALVEGLFFSSSFAAIYFLKGKGILPGLTFSNELIARDEGLHMDFAVLLYNQYLSGDQKLTEAFVHAMVRDAVALEDDFVCSALPVSLLGMNQDLMCQYVHYVADRLLSCLGYTKLWNVECPFGFMMNISIENKTNFFERRVSEYKRTNVMMNAKQHSTNAFQLTKDF